VAFFVLGIINERACFLLYSLYICDNNQEDKSIMNNYYRFLLIFLISLGWISKAFSNPIDSIPVFFHQQLLLYPQEKLYLHTDKNHYIQGEKIWFRAYLVDAATHKPESYSRYVYVELIGKTDTAVSRVMISPDKEFFHGYLPIPDALSSGEYMLRAYTRYMENEDEDYFFKKNIQVGTYVTKENSISNNEFHVSFFPEGGDLPLETAATIAFKAVQSSGNSEEITGRIVDEMGEEVTTFSSVHGGMGIFQLYAREGKKYYAECTNSQGQMRRFELPTAKAAAISLQVRSVRNNYIVSLLTNKTANVSENYYLLIHCRGQVYYVDAWDHNKPYISFEKNLFPTGIVQILFLNEKKQPVSERLVFCMNGNDKIETSISTNKEAYNTREKIITSVRVQDMNGNLVTGNFSVAITDNADVRPDSAVTILSSLLLTSELKGYIESPGWYFMDPTPNKIYALDCLMLTQGWRRYSIPRILAQDYEIPEIEYEQGMQIKGNLFNPRTKKKYANAQVGFAASEDNMVHVTLTDENGDFTLSGFEYPDSTIYMLTAITQKEDDQKDIKITPPSYPLVTGKLPGIMNPFDIVTQEQYSIKAHQKLSREREAYNILLEDVTVDAKSKPRNIRSPFVAGRSDARLTLEDIKKRDPHSIKSLLQAIPGFRITKGVPYHRNTPLKILIDGVDIISGAGADSDLEDFLFVEDVLQVDLVTRPSAVFDTEKLLVITTKSSVNYVDPPESSLFIHEIMPLGYQQNIEFYSPVYESEEQKKSSLPDLRTTLFWSPVISLSPDGDAEFSFYAGDSVTSYSVVIEGLSDEGEIIREQAEIIVR